MMMKMMLHSHDDATWSHMMIMVIRKSKQVMMAIFWHPTLYWLNKAIAKPGVGSLPACRVPIDWKDLLKSKKIHQFNIRAVDQISSVCDLFKVELNRIEKLDNSLLVWPIAKIQGMPKSEEEKNFKIWFKPSPITEEIMAANIFQCGY